MKVGYIIAIVLVAALAVAGYFYFTKKPAEPAPSSPAATRPSKEARNPPRPWEQTPQEPNEPAPAEPMPEEQKPDVGQSPEHGVLNEVYGNMTKIAQCIGKSHELPSIETVANACNAEDLTLLETALKCFIEKGVCRMGELMANQRHATSAEAEELKVELQNLNQALDSCLPQGALSESCQRVGK